MGNVKHHQLINMNYHRFWEIWNIINWRIDTETVPYDSFMLNTLANIFYSKINKLTGFYDEYKPCIYHKG